MKNHHEWSWCSHANINLLLIPGCTLRIHRAFIEGFLKAPSEGLLKFQSHTCSSKSLHFLELSFTSRTHHSRHGEALEQKSFAAITVSLKDHEVSVMADLPSQRPVNQICNY